jgi:phosphoribosyl-AMP cyclohydrolase
MAACLGQVAWSGPWTGTLRDSAGNALSGATIKLTSDRPPQFEALGPGVCHKGYQSCFFRKLENGQWVESEPRTYDPDAVYGDKA